MGVLLRAAASVGIRVHLGLAAQMHLKTPSGENALYVNSTVLGAFRQFAAKAFHVTEPARNPPRTRSYFSVWPRPGAISRKI